MNYEIIDCSTPYTFIDEMCGFFHDTSDQNVYLLEFTTGTVSQSPHKLIISDTIENCMGYIKENDLSIIV